MSTENDHPMSLKEAADYARVSTRSIQHHTAQGRLKGYKIPGGRWHRWYKSDVDAWLKSADSDQEAS